MTDGHCQDILDELPPKFHTMARLADRPPEILYPLQDGVIWTETDKFTDATQKLYDGMISTFENFVAS